LLRIKGELLLRESSYYSSVAAEQLYEKAFDVARIQGALFWELRTAVSIAQLRASQYRPREAYETLASVCRKFTEGFAQPELQRANAMLAQLSEH
jgi:predicted ATPase